VQGVRGPTSRNPLPAQLLSVRAKRELTSPASFTKERGLQHLRPRAGRGGAAAWWTCVLKASGLIQNKYSVTPGRGHRAHSHAPSTRLKICCYGKRHALLRRLRRCKNASGELPPLLLMHDCIAPVPPFARKPARFRAKRWPTFQHLSEETGFAFCQQNHYGQKRQEAPPMARELVAMTRRNHGPPEYRS
jgi:hypothetical protein